MPVTSSTIDTEREAARTAAVEMDGLQHEMTVLAEQMGALGSSVGPDVWCGDSADAFRGHVAELGQNATGLAQGYDDVAVALRGHAQALDGLYDEVKDAEKRLADGKAALSAARADFDTARQSVERAQGDLLAAQQQARRAAADPTGAAQSLVGGAVSGAQDALTAARTAVTNARTAVDEAEGDIRTAEVDLGDATRQHERAGDRCADEVLDARDLPFHTAAWEFVVSAIRNMGGNDWGDFFNGAAMSTSVAARNMMDRADEVGSTLRALKDARRRGTPAERQAARTAYNAALREVRQLRRAAGGLPWQPPGWLRRVNVPLGQVSQTLSRIPGVRSLPVIGVALAADSTRRDAEELGMTHAVVKNAASVAAGAGVAALVAGGSVALAPVVAGVVVGTVVAVGVGYAVEEYGDEAVELAGDAASAVGNAASGLKNAIGGLLG